MEWIQNLIKGDILSLFFNVLFFQIELKRFGQTKERGKERMKKKEVMEVKKRKRKKIGA